MPARVLHESEVSAGAVPGGEIRVLIDASSGSRELLQRLLRVVPGGEARLEHLMSEEILYVVEGSGWGWGGTGDEDRHRLEPGTAALIQPQASARIVAGGDGLAVVSVLSPQPPPGDVAIGGTFRDLPLRVTREQDQEPQSAGEDRTFRVLVDPRFGCRNVTQFVGAIERSRAPFHTHTYEEAIYVLGGEGVLHADGLDAPIVRGSSVFLPPGTPHCLENAGSETLRLLGVFSPPGSPAGRAEPKQVRPG